MITTTSAIVVVSPPVVVVVVVDDGVVLAPNTEKNIYIYIAFKNNVLHFLSFLPVVKYFNYT